MGTRPYGCHWSAAGQQSVVWLRMMVHHTLSYRCTHYIRVWMNKWPIPPTSVWTWPLYIHMKRFVPLLQWMGVIRPATHGAIYLYNSHMIFRIRLGVVWMQYINLYNWVLNNNQIVYRSDFYSGVVEVSILYHREKAKEHLYDWWEISLS